ncbi:MAG: hypothetical protein A2275_05030 [Bacteroidetes bacterium RIFOXYA12_FULL_35_11]|nr:MAG: hypothetical protein A2X01_07465 [Bacteroidetes bacterium GWF2_35_48]OFY78136.1 MAG: hypothetical protein A2275_05030 [Bacteroidetes bacterium RIFOXYA12_FULL_35_11]OFY92591.1 MAG: hypothetical protein A2491_08585 [Bacteroidetes bacterium RIFOXYC12_FULL_35_7]OFY94690.1 MAG: hypothetical protein A2309_07495 [Bacteroidetes bacterium RIFOXYB2_FULL_35_7]HBX52892.1 hypothetical protein [Bacteroidales bacterium]
MKKTALISGAGPAGLTAAYELLKRTDIIPVVFEKSGDIGGISKTVNYKGNRMDIGGHRFFSKSSRVMEWWKMFLPLQSAPARDEKELIRLGHEKKIQPEIYPDGTNPEETDKTMLIRRRLSRIFYLRKFFSYPVSLNLETISNLGILRIIKIGFSYMYVGVFPVKKEKSLEDFFINRFGKELYLTFFKDYTQKVWGVPCDQIKPEWGAQRIKGLSITKAVIHALKSSFSKPKSIDQKNVETSLIEKFMYPKLGPGQLWEEVAQQVREKGGRVVMNTEVLEVLHISDDEVQITVKDNISGEVSTITGNYFFSTMPVKELIAAVKNSVPENVKNVAENLVYRDFITVGLLLNKLLIKNKTDIPTLHNLVPDNWIYIQERDVKVGRLQIFNNWSPYMVKESDKVWIGLEYFCNEGDELWSMTDEQFMGFAKEELSKIAIIDKKDVLDSTIIRMPKTYPAYFGSYDRLQEVIDFMESFKNIFLIGRNGMHRYNNQDHSMLTAMTAVDNIVKGITSKENIWQINTEEEYHETAKK